jgi:hypothetical protein
LRLPAKLGVLHFLQGITSFSSPQAIQLRPPCSLTGDGSRHASEVGYFTQSVALVYGQF